MNSKESGRLPIFLFSSIKRDAEGTALAIGSHKVAAHVLAHAEPRGLKGSDVSKETLKALNAAGSGTSFLVEQIVGEAGDVMLTHPFLLHARSKNLGPLGDPSSVRFMCNPNVGLMRPMRFPAKLSKLAAHAAKHYRHYTPIEQAIVDGVLQE